MPSFWQCRLSGQLLIQCVMWDSRNAAVPVPGMWPDLWNPADLNNFWKQHGFDIPMIFLLGSKYSNAGGGVYTVCAIQGTMILRPVAKMFVYVCVVLFGCLVCCYIIYKVFCARQLWGHPHPQILVCHPSANQVAPKNLASHASVQDQLDKHHKFGLRFDFFDQLRMVHVYGSKQKWKMIHRNCWSCNGCGLWQCGGQNKMDKLSMKHIGLFSFGTKILLHMVNDLIDVLVSNMSTWNHYIQYTSLTNNFMTDCWIPNSNIQNLITNISHAGLAWPCWTSSGEWIIYSSIFCVIGIFPKWKHWHSMLAVALL